MHINATCDETSCKTKLCDVAVAFNVMLAWQVLPHPFKYGINSYIWDHYEIIYYVYHETKRDKAKLYEVSRTDVLPGIRLKLGHLMFSSWNYAHKYCQERNLHLSTLTPSLREHLIYTINLEYGEHGFNLSGSYIFAGLHRRNKVSAA